MNDTKHRSRSLDALKLFSNCTKGALHATIRRVWKGPLRKSWNWQLETIVGFQKGTYALLAQIGPERYQRTLSGLLTQVRSRGTKVSPSDLANAPGHWFTPDRDNGAVILYFHGGGYVYGSVATHGELIGAIATACSARVLALDYRLAPEYPYPAAIDDAVAAYRCLVESGVSPQQIVFAGDSAGGGLVLSTLVALRDAGDTLPVAGVAISPWVDLTCIDQSFATNALYDSVSQEACLVAAAAYLDGADPRNPHISPRFADLSRLPPLLIHAGGLEVLHDQICAFADKAKSFGVTTTLSVYPEMVHVWHMLMDFTPEASKAIGEIAAFVSKHTNIK